MTDREPRDDGYESDLDGHTGERDDERQLADRRWIDALLRRTFRPEVARRETRVTRALAAVRRDAVRHRDGFRTQIARPPQAARRLWTTAPAAAALLLIALGIVWVVQVSPQVTADEAIRNAYAAALSMQDREYAVRVDLARPELGPMAGSVYLRGETHFCMRFDTRRFGEAWFGSNGQEGWVVPGLEAFPVMVTRDLAQLYERLEAFNIQGPFLQITTTIETLREHYDIELETPSHAQPGAPPLFVRVRGTRRADHPFLADRIEFLAHPQRGTIQQLTVEWTDPASRSRIRRLTLDLVSEKPLADDWYEHQAHHGPDRPVRDMTGQSWGPGRRGVRPPHRDR